MRITVLGGGESSERAVSAASTAAVTAALRESGHSVVAIDPAVWPRPAEFATGVDRLAPPAAEGDRLAASFRANLRDEEFWHAIDGDVVFLALHGGIGESGELKAELERRGIRSTGACSEVMARSWDKIDTLATLAASSVPVPRAFEAGVNARWIVKPARDGSSIGVYKCDSADEVDAALARVDGPAVVEEFLPGAEFTVGIVGSVALPPVLIEAGDGWFGYEQKYQIGRSREICPAPIDNALRDNLIDLARRSTDALGFGDRSYARVDLMLDAEGNPRVLEVNSLPGLTTASLLPLAAGAAGWSFPALCERILRFATVA